MRATFVSALLAGLILVTVPARGEDKQLTPPGISPAIAARIHWIQFAMVSGRVVASSNLSVPKMLVQSPGRRTQRRESLGIEINGGSCSMEYLLVAPLEALRIDVLDGSTLSIRRTRSMDGYTLDFQQRPDRPLLLALEEGAVKRQWQAQGLWHLYLLEPELVRDHLLPLLEQLHPSWQLADTAAQIEEALVRTQHVHGHQRPERQRWAQWVQQLGSTKFSERESAERELRQAGQAAVPYLQSLSPEQLDAEQSTRIRAIVASLSVAYEDRVDRVAAWLAGDESIWLALLGRDDPARRRIAAEQLGQLLGEAVDFDPDGPAEVRHEQLERLRGRLLEPTATLPMTR
ncbi:MAG: hypothetical protein WD845_08900 [Pirellulales bacterium]